MSGKTYHVDEVISFVFRLDPGGLAKLRRGHETADLLLIPGMASLLSHQHGNDLEDTLLAARIASVIGDGGNGAPHPGAALARASFHERRMARLLASDPEMLPDRLLATARFLSAKRVRAKVSPFYWLVRESRASGNERERIQWARAFGEAAENVETHAA